MSYPTYPGGYIYPNELVQGAEYGSVVWVPIIAVYMTLIAIASGSAMLLAIRTVIDIRVLKKLTPLLFIASLSASLVMLLGPLADLRRPDHFYKLLATPHIIPTAENPGVSPIALMAAVMWPLLLVLIVALGVLNNAVPRIKIHVSRWLAVSLSIALLAVSAVWATYHSLLLYTSVARATFYNYLPLIPAEQLIQALVIASGVIAILAVAHRVELAGEEIRTLALIPLAGAGLYAFFRVSETFRIYIYTSGSEIGSTLVSALEPLNTLAIALAIVIAALSYISYRSGSIKTAAVSGLVSIAWVLGDRWLLTINIQSISRTGIAILPQAMASWIWVAESIALVLLFLFVYLLLTYISPIPGRGVSHE